MGTKTTSQELSELCASIATEHYNFTKDNKGDNINYMWYLYSVGVHKGHYRPFILMAEMNLCKHFQLINEEECNNLLNMLKSEDEDNAYIAMHVVKKIMHDRHDQFGKDTDLEVYKDIRDNYSSKVMSHELFIKTKKT